MNTIKLNKSLALEIISFLLILLFFYTALSKGIKFSTFRISLLESPLIGRDNLPREWTYFIGWGLIVAELLVAMLLAIPKTKLIGLYGSLTLMLLFTFYIAYILVFFGKDVPCSCGGVIAYLNWPQHLIFNIIFTLLSALGIWIYGKPEKQIHQAPDNIIA